MNQNLLILAGIAALIITGGYVNQKEKNDFILELGTDYDQSLVPDYIVHEKFHTSLENKMRDIYNEKGGYIEKKAKELGIDEQDIAGVIKVESSGHGFDDKTGRMIIRFENHQFYNYYTNKGKDSARVATFRKYFRYNSNKRWTGHQYRKSTSAQWQNFHGNQHKEWDVINFARTLDEDAALKSASYGCGQIMGFNYKACGYSNVKTMFNEFGNSIKAQLDGLLGFVKNNRRCYNALKASPTQYENFAKCYNGPGQAATYGKLIKNASNAYKSVIDSRCLNIYICL